MALAVLYELSGMTHQRYGATMRALNFDKRRPPELKVHTAFVKDDGGWQIFEVWDSVEVWETLWVPRYLDALRGRGRTVDLNFLSTQVHQDYTND